MEVRKLIITRFLLALVILVASHLSANAQSYGGGVSGAPLDPCQNVYVAKSTAVVNIGAAGTGLLVQGVTGKSIYVCGYHLTNTGTNPALKFEYGTQVTTACDTGTTALSGLMGASSGVSLAVGGFQVFSAPAGQQLCAVISGTSPSLQGVMSYVQQ